MKIPIQSLVAFFLLVGLASELHAQELELGELPPMPNLNLGDPDTKLTWNQSRLRSRVIARERQMEEKERKLIASASEEAPRPRLSQRLSDTMGQQRKTATSERISVQNSLPYGEDGITASGSRLRPFGDDRYWGAMPSPTPEEALAELPPLPDLRVPDQITKKERLRDNLVARQAIRKAEADAAREKKELLQRALVNRPVADPSTALVQVSPSSSGASYVGNQVAPGSVVEGRTLKPFNENSTYTQGNQIVYKGPRLGTSSSGGGLFRRSPKP